MAGLKFPNQPFEPPSIYDWVERSLKHVEQQPFLNLGNIVGTTQGNVSYDKSKCVARPEEYWKRLTPRSPKIVELFTRIAIRPSSPTDFVQKMVELGIDSHFLETLPEGLATPLREAITACQADPPTTWSEQALRLVGRDDVRLLVAPDHEKKESSKLQLVCLALGTFEIVGCPLTFCSPPRMRLYEMYIIFASLPLILRQLDPLTELPR